MKGLLVLIKKYKYIFASLFLLCLLFLLISKKTYTHPIGGWSVIKTKLESEFKYNEDIKNAALQMGAAIQKSIDYPEEAFSAQKQISKGLSCLYGVLEFQKVGTFEISDIVSKTRDISVSTFSERVRRYIRYNSNLSGHTFYGTEANIGLCVF